MTDESHRSSIFLFAIDPGPRGLLRHAVAFGGEYSAPIASQQPRALKLLRGQYMSFRRPVAVQRTCSKADTAALVGFGPHPTLPGLVDVSTSPRHRTGILNVDPLAHLHPYHGNSAEPASESVTFFQGGLLRRIRCLSWVSWLPGYRLPAPRSGRVSHRPVCGRAVHGGRLAALGQPSPEGAALIHLGGLKVGSRP
jgi:hypothetical protein